MFARTCTYTYVQVIFIVIWVVSYRLHISSLRFSRKLASLFVYYSKSYEVKPLLTCVVSLFLYKLQSLNVLLCFTENFPPRIEGSGVFVVNLHQESFYFFNVSDEGDSFTVAISGGQPNNSTLRSNGSLYTFTWTLMELKNSTVTFVANDSFDAVSMLTPQIQICACENNGTCTIEGLTSVDQNPLVLNCECSPGTDNSKGIFISSMILTIDP